MQSNKLITKPELKIFMLNILKLVVRNEILTTYILNRFAKSL